MIYKGPRPLSEQALRAGAGPSLTVFLEGDDDRRFWASRVRRGVTLQVAGSRDAVQAAVLAARESGQVHVIGIVDADFDRVLGQTSSLPGIFEYDGHDLEVMTFAVDALEKVLVEHGSETKARPAQDVRKDVFERALDWGRLQLAGKKLAIGVKPHKSRIYNAKLVKAKGWVCARGSDLVSQIRNFHGLKKDDMARLQTEFLCAPVAPEIDICVGHDLCYILARGLERELGSTASLDGEAVATALRLAFSGRELRATSLWVRLAAYFPAVDSKDWTIETALKAD